MSSRGEFTEFEGHRKAAVAAAVPEKLSFSQKCSLLSHYLKENGSFVDLRRGMKCNIESNENGTPDVAATMLNLFPAIEQSYDAQTRNMGSLRNLRAMDLFPQQAGFTSLSFKEDSQQNVGSSDNKFGTLEPQTAQMTIFYAGQVFVFDDIPAGKAKEIMHLPSKGSSKSRNTAFPPTTAKRNPIFASNVFRSPSESSPDAIPSFGKNLIQEHVQPPLQPLSRDLPIARSASLQRFLEKRKDRIAARAPYQPSSASVSLFKPTDSRSWLGLTVQSQH